MKSVNTILVFLIPRLQDALFAALFMGAIVLGPRMINDDLGRHLATGRYMVSTLQIPTHDLFSFTKQGQSRPPYEWVSQILFYIAYLLLNLDGVVIFTAIILALAFLIVFIDSFRRSSMPVLASALTLWAAAASSLHWLARPHIFTFLFIAIWIQWLEKIRKGEKITLWLFPALMLAWANIHGGFIFGFLAWLAYIAGWLWDFWRKQANRQIGRNLMIIGGSSLLASILTPDLWRNWQGVLNNNSVYILSHTSETLPPNFALPGTFPFTILLAFALVLLLTGWERFPTSHITLLLGFSVLSLIMARNIPLFSIVVAPILAGYLGRIINKIPSWSSMEERVVMLDAALRGTIWTILIPLITVGIFINYQARTLTPFNQFNPRTFPVQAVDWIELHSLKGNMFNDFNWGGYLLFRLWPRDQVFIDSQSDFYGETFTRQYAGVLIGGDNWEGKLSQYAVNWILVMPNSGLDRAASISPAWQKAYEDPVAVIYVRK